MKTIKLELSSVIEIQVPDDFDEETVAKSFADHTSIYIEKPDECESDHVGLCLTFLNYKIRTTILY